MSNLSKLNDRQLIEIYQSRTNTVLSNKAAEILIKRYEPQINRNWWVLRRQFGGSSLIDGYSNEYYSEAYEAILLAINSIDLKKIRDDNWKLVQYSGFYLKNARNKVAKKVSKAACIRPLDNLSSFAGGDESKENITDPEVERAYYEEEGYKHNPEDIIINEEALNSLKKIINNCYNHWTEEKRNIFKLLLAGKSKKEIAEILGMRRNSLYNRVAIMEKEIKKKMKEVS